MRFVSPWLLLLILPSCSKAQTEVSRSPLFEYDPIIAGVDENGRAYAVVDGDTIHISFLGCERKPSTERLTNEDYIEVAEELGVEPAAIKAVVEIETGRVHSGFYDIGKPLVNFDLSVFRTYARRNGVDLSKFTRSHSVVFSKPNVKKYGSYQGGQHARLEKAMEIDSLTAVQGTFWGLFQLGGFNWKKCGAESPSDFVEKMSRSERDQLEMFASFIKNSGLLKALRNKDWATFAKGYNGPSYAAKGYHRRLAAAYKKYKNSINTLPQ